MIRPARPIPQRPALGVLLAACLLLPCTAAAQFPSPRDSTRLVSRLTTLHLAIAGNDAATWYGMLTPAVRQAMSLEEFRADVGLADARPTEPPPGFTVRLERGCGCQALEESPGTLACVLVLRLAAESPRREARDLESWARIEGEWYWLYGEPHRGNQPPEPPRCPGER